MHHSVVENGRAAVLHAPDACGGMFLLRFCTLEERAGSGGDPFGPVVASFELAVFDESCEQALFEKLARRLIPAMRERQAQGPYRLAGRGDAGLLAYEMAYQLIGADDTVGFLGLVGTAYPADGAAQGRDPAALRLSLAPVSVPLTVLVAQDAAGAAAAAAWTRHGGARTAVLTAGDASGIGAPAAWLALLADSLAAQAALPVPSEEQGYAPANALQSGRRGAVPLFCVPGAGASITAFIQLAGELGGDMPIHGMQPRGLCGTMVPHIDVESAAASYVKALLALVPRGPFHLAGHSYGGWVAFEMARRLAALGRPPASVFLLDSRSPSDPARSTRHYSSAQAFAKLVELYNMQLDQPIRLSAADFAPLSQEAKLALLLSHLVSAKILPRQATVDSLKGMVRVFQRNLNTLYTPSGAYDRPVDIVVALDERANGESAFAGWRAHAPAAREWRSSANHMTLLSLPYVGELASHMRNVMREAEEQ